LEVALGVAYPVPPLVAHSALQRWYAGSGQVVSAALLDIRARHLGRHDTMGALARAVAEDNFSTGDRPVDFDAWPFSQIDWDTAAIDVNEAVSQGLLVEVGDHEWFNRAPARNAHSRPKAAWH